MKKLLLAVSALALMGLPTPSQAEEVGVIDGVWSVRHDPVGAPSIGMKIGEGCGKIRINWTPTLRRDDPQKAFLQAIIPGRYFNCSAKKVRVIFKDGASYELTGSGDCLTGEGVVDASGVNLDARDEDAVAIAQELAKGSLPVRIFYGSQSIALHGTGQSAALAAYKRDIDPALNPDFFEKFGIK